MQTIILNILQNAVKASTQGTIIKIGNGETANSMQIRNEEGAFKQQEYETAIQNDYANKNLSGLGLKLVDEPAQKIDISVNFKGSAGNQTICTIQF